MVERLRDFLFVITFSQKKRLTFFYSIRIPYFSNFLILSLTITYDPIGPELYDKRDPFDFCNLRFPHKSGTLPSDFV